MAERPHGYARYKLDNCRCYVCGWALCQYNLRRDRMIAYGTWQPFTAAQPVREHLAVLSAAGIGYKRVAVLAGLGASTVGNIVFGRLRSGPTPTPATKIRTETARKILAVRPALEGPANAAVIAGAGTNRRIQGMCVMGWSLIYQAEQIGWTVQNISRMPTAPTVLARTARAVAAVYDRISSTEPDNGLEAARVRRWAAKRHFLPPAVWDDDTIDDPRTVPCVLPPVDGSDPDVDEHALTVAYLYRDHPITPALRAELVRRMAVSGYALAEIADAARTTTNYVSNLRGHLGLTRRTAVAA